MPRAAPFALLLGAACGGPPGGASLDGEALYSLHGCNVCHGDAGEGRSLGPALVGVGLHWTREELARFLLEPRVVIAETPRLAELDLQYPSEMRPYRNTTAEERLRIADFLLSLE